MKSIKTFGLILMIISLIFALYKRTSYGYHVTHKTSIDLMCDVIAIILFSVGLLFVCISKNKK